MARSLTNEEWRDIKNDIENSKALFNKPMMGLKESYNVECKRYHDYIRGIFDSKDIRGLKGKNNDDVVIVNEYWINRSILMPNLFFQRPEVKATARYDSVSYDVQDPASKEIVQEVNKAEMSGATAEAALNYYAAEGQLNDEFTFEQVLSDALISFGVLKTGWHYEDDKTTGYRELSPNWGNAMSVDDKRQALDSAVLLAEKQRNGDRIEGESLPGLTPKIDTLTSEYLPSENYLPDVECADHLRSTARFSGFRYLLPNKWVNQFFGKKYEPQSTALWANPENIITPELSLKRNEVIEIWDKELASVIYLVDADMENPALVLDWPFAIDGFPEDVMTFNPDNRLFLPIPDFRHIKRQVDERIRLRTKMATLLRIMHQVWLADGKISSKLNDLLEGGEGTVIPLTRNDNDTRNLDGFLKAVADFTLSESLFAYDRLISSDIERISGLSDYQRGLIQDVKQTATAAMQISQSQNIKIEKRQAEVARFIRSVNRKRLQLLQQNATLPKLIKITRRDKVEWKAFSKEDIQGNFDFEVDVSSMLRKNKEVFRKHTMEKIEIIEKNPRLSALEDPKAMLKDLHLAFDDKNIEARMVPSSPPPEPKPEPPRISVSLKAEDLGLPQVQMLLKAAGVVIPEMGPMAPEAIGGLPGELPTGDNLPIEEPPMAGGEDMAVQELAGAMRV